jgi:glycosyltransferase involved in cell wall biosynthesis
VPRIGYNHARKRLTWITYLDLDRQVHKTSRIEILRHLAERGYQVHLIAACSRRRQEANLRVCCIPLKYVRAMQAPFLSVVLFFMLPLYALRRKPNFIITEPSILTLAFVWTPLLSRVGTRVILDIRSSPVVVQGRLASIQALIFKISVLIANRLFAGITVITSMMKYEIARQIGISPASMGVWTDGVSLTVFDPANYRQDRVRLRKENNLDSSFVVLYHGAMGLNRGLIETVESVNLLKHRYDDIVLFLLGDGPAVPQIKKIIREKKLEHRVILHDVVGYSDVPKYIAMSEVGIVPLPNSPDWRYQCPLNLLEYLAMEKPVVMTDIPANRMVVGDRRCGIYAVSDSSKAIAEGIAFAHESRNMLKEWGREGRMIMKERYDWATVAQKLDSYLVRRGQSI